MQKYYFFLIYTTLLLFFAYQTNVRARVCARRNEKNDVETIFFTKKCKNVCSIQKKVVTLHDFSCIVEWSRWRECT